jgi:ubiquitin C-terminal hydrolase
LVGDNTVNCSNCGTSTIHTYSRSCNPDVFLIELIRITNTARGLTKNMNPIRFLPEVKLPGFSRSYRVVASAHHRGSLRGGHWVTRVCTVNGWFEVDDLRRKHMVTDPPGVSDDSVVVILLVASDLLS